MIHFYSFKYYLFLEVIPETKFPTGGDSSSLRNDCLSPLSTVSSEDLPSKLSLGIEVQTSGIRGTAP